MPPQLSVRTCRCQYQCQRCRCCTLCEACVLVPPRPLSLLALLQSSDLAGREFYEGAARLALYHCFCLCILDPSALTASSSLRHPYATNQTSTVPRRHSFSKLGLILPPPTRASSTLWGSHLGNLRFWYCKTTPSYCLHLPFLTTDTTLGHTTCSHCPHRHTSCRSPSSRQNVYILKVRQTCVKHVVSTFRLPS